MVPLGSVVTLRDTSGPYRVVRHNLFPTAELQGDTKPGHSSGEALGAMEALATKHLPGGFGFEWTELAYQQKTAGNTAAIVFALAVFFGMIGVTIFGLLFTPVFYVIASWAAQNAAKLRSRNRVPPLEPAA